MNTRWEIHAPAYFFEHLISSCNTHHDYVQQVHQALLEQAKKCSVLLISNKMSVVEKASHIIVLSEGTVKEEGSHDELLRKGGLYADLVEKQNSGFHRQEGEKKGLQ